MRNTVLALSLSLRFSVLTTFLLTIFGNACLATDDPGCRGCLSQGATLFASGKDAEAITYLKEWSVKCPSNAQLHLMLSTIYLRTGNTKAAELAAKQACDIDSNCLPAHLQYAMASQQNRRPQQAIEAYTRVTELDPGSYEAWSALGDLHKQQRNDGQAAHAYEMASELEPGRRNARIAALRNLKSLNKFAEARAELKKIAMVKPATPEQAIELAQEALSIGAFDEAIRICSQVTAGKQKPLALRVIGACRIAESHWDEALAAGEQLSQIETTGCDGLALKGLALTGLGKLDEAGTLVAQALDQQPRSCLALLCRGEIELAQDKVTEAANSLQESLESDVGNANLQELPHMIAHLYLSKAYLKQNKPDDAVDEAQLVVSDQRLVGPAALALACAYDKKGLRSEAARHFKQAVDAGLTGKDLDDARAGLSRNQ